MTIPAAIALDHSATALAIAVAQDGQLIFQNSLPRNGNAPWLPWLIAQLALHDCAIRQLHTWTVGTGPGSFSGIRVLAAFVAGITAGRDGIRARGIPSPIAMAAATTSSTNSVAILQPRRDGRIVLCHALRHHHDWHLASPPAMVTDATAIHRLDPTPQAWTALAEHRAALTAILPDDTPKIVFHEHFPAAALLSVNPHDWRRDTIHDIIYSHPPVTLPPKAFSGVSPF